MLDQRRAQGEKLVFTNGVFDLIHPGHVRYLRDARIMGEMLVVALNTDDSVRRLKGPLRPILPFVERAKIIASLEMVDYVTFFDEVTSLETIVLLHPDILVKGGDYTLDGIVGRNEVETMGGIVRSIPFVQGFASTLIIERIVQSASVAPTR